MLANVNVAAAASAKVAPNRASFFFILLSLQRLLLPLRRLRPHHWVPPVGSRMVELSGTAYIT